MDNIVTFEENDNEYDVFINSKGTSELDIPTGTLSYNTEINLLGGQEYLDKNGLSQVEV